MFSKNEIDWQRILYYIDTNIHNDIDFTKLAEDNNYSYDRFSHLFKEHFGLSLYTYLTRQRIEHAKLLLKSSNLSLTVVAFDCGFNSSSQFSNIFKKYTNMTPKEYRLEKTNF